MKISLTEKPKKARERRIKDRKENPKSNPTNKDIIEFLNDTNDRLAEIYDALKRSTQ